MNNLYQISHKDIPFENKHYRLFIAVPKNHQKALSVLYTLDGNAQFPLAVNAVDSSKPLPLIVSIGYMSDKTYAIEERTRDYTFPVIGKEFAQGGQAANFLRFIRQDVKPYIAQHYKIKKDEEYFFGHSFGGLFGLYILFNQADLFQYYILASPSLWWGKGTFFPRNNDWISHKPQKILVTLGQYEEFPEKDPNITTERLVRINKRKLMQTINARQLVKELNSQGNNTEFISIFGKNHGDSIPDAIKQTMEFIQSH